jgi:hypothetical protein
MLPDRIKLSHEFPGLWLSVEIPVGPGENVIEEFKKGKDWLLTAYRELSGGNYADIPGHPQTLQPDTKEQRILGIAEAIKSCTTLISLERFRQMVERENVDVLYEAYTNKKKEFKW